MSSDEIGKITALASSEKKTNSNKKIQPATSPDRSAPELPPKPIREQAKVLFPYEAQNEDELTLKEGDIITVLSKEIEDKGWWKGELNNQIGVFPDNFVELIKVEEVSQKKPDRPEKPSFPVSPKINSKPELSNDSPLDTYLEKKRSKTPPAKPPPPKVIEKEKPERPAPPYPNKKPQLPPPVKKPLRSSLGAKIADTVSSLPSSLSEFINSVSNSSSSIVPHISKETVSSPQTENKVDIESCKKSVNETPKSCDNQQNDTCTFDSVELSTDKLVHLTATRAKAPNRRPPSYVFLKENVDSSNAQKLEIETSSVQSFSNSAITTSAAAATVTTTATEFVEQVTQLAISNIPPSEFSLSDKVPSSVSPPEEQNWKTEVCEIKSNIKLISESMVSRNEYEELLTQVNSFKRIVHNLKAELEEEKKMRISMQLELEKLKKCIAS